MPLATNARLPFAPNEAGAGRHFRNHQTGAEPFGQPPERRVGNSRHGAKTTRFGTAIAPMQATRPRKASICSVSTAIAYHLGCPFSDAHSLANLQPRKCCTAKNCSFLCLRSGSYRVCRAGRNAVKARRTNGAREMAQVAAVVVAAGQGVRAGGDLPKQFRRIAGRNPASTCAFALCRGPHSCIRTTGDTNWDLALVRQLTQRHECPGAGIWRRYPTGLCACRSRGAASRIARHCAGS